MEIQCNNSTTTAHIKPQSRIQTVSESAAGSTDPRAQIINVPEVVGKSFLQSEKILS